MLFMHHLSLLFSTLLIGIIPLSIVAQADTNFDNSKDRGNDFKKSLLRTYEQRQIDDRRAILAEYKALERLANKNYVPKKFHFEVTQIEINGRIAIVNSRGTITSKTAIAHTMNEETWQRNDGGWKMVKTRLLSSSVATKRPQVNQTGQVRTSHNVHQALSLGADAIEMCYGKKDLQECDKLARIEATLSDWCGSNDQDACAALMSIQSQESSAMTSGLVDRIR
jgi:hypothetical protein